MSQINILELEKQVLEEEAEALEKFLKGTGEAPVIYRAASGAVTKADGDSPIEFVLSHESDDRMGDIIRQDGWDLANFKRNPVMLWAHDSRGIPPIGRWAKVRVEGKSLVGIAQFDPDDPFAQSIEGKVRRGFLNAVSVGFRPLEMEWRDDKDGEGGFFRPAADFKKQELLETSVVSVPAHPKALRKALELAVDGTPEAKRFIFLPGENFGTFEVKAIEEPPAQDNKDAHADETDTVEADSRATMIVKVDTAELEQAVNRFTAAVEQVLSKASTVAADEDAVTDSESDDDPPLETDSESADLDDEDTLAIEQSLAEIRSALKVGDKKDAD